MCGTPVVSFEMGVASDLVRTGETGYLARIKDSKDLAQGVFNTLMLNRENFDRLSENCRNLALKLCSPQVQINKFENIIKSITTD
jgi:glycosyltransferase involved in cell wall biosynthesis